MKKQFLGLIAIIGFLTFLMADVSAQTGKSARVNVKFDFQVGEKTYPAGEYIVESISSANDNLLQVRSAAKGKRQLIIANILNTGKIEQPKLVFQKNGKEVFLSQIFLTNSKWGFALKPSAKQAKYSASAETETLEVRLPN